MINDVVLYCLKHESFESLVVKLLIQRDQSGEGGCLLLNDPHEFLRTARELGL